MSQAVSNPQRTLQQGRRGALSDQGVPRLRPPLITHAEEGNRTRYPKQGAQEAGKESAIAGRARKLNPMPPWTRRTQVRHALGSDKFLYCVRV